MAGIESLFAKRIQGSQSSIVRDLLRYSKMPNIVSLAGGIPAADMFDMEGINAALNEVIESKEVNAYQYSTTDGELVLQEEIVKLIEERGIDAACDEIVVTSGSQQGLDLISRTFLDEGDVILVERPTYLAAIQGFKLTGATVEDVEGGPEGLNVDALEARLKKGPIKALYIVPTFANPTGSTLSDEKRERLLKLAVEHNFVIFEDDPYGEIRFTDQLAKPIYSLAKSEEEKEHIVYLSSFSKVLVPGLRLGFIVTSRKIREKIVICKQSVDLHTPVLSQLIVANYLKSGRLQPRIKEISKAYQKRCQHLIDSLKKHTEGKISFDAPTGGMFLWAKLPEGMSATELLKHAIDAEVVFVPGAAFYVGTPEDNTLRLSFATVTEESAEEAGKRLAIALKNYEEAIAKA